MSASAAPFDDHANRIAVQDALGCLKTQEKLTNDNLQTYGTATDPWSMDTIAGFVDACASVVAELEPGDVVTIEIDRHGTPGLGRGPGDRLDARVAAIRSVVDGGADQSG
jgi:hypothetical protein